MADSQISTPPTSTGILRFYDVNSSKVQIDPKLVLGFAVGLVVVEVLIQALH